MPVKRATEQNSQKMSTPAFVSLMIGGLVVVSGGAFFIGKSDHGQINVAATIQNSNQANIAAEGDPSNNVGNVPEAFRNMPNGGLVPAENQEPTPPPAPIDDTTASGTATSTDAEGATDEEATTEGESVTTEGDGTTTEEVTPDIIEN